MLLSRVINEPIRESLSWESAWRGEDGGLIKCWENGRLRRRSRHDDDVKIVESAVAGEFQPLDWAGGILGDPNMKKRYGSFNYLATWQGLRGEDLHIDTSREIEYVCTRTGIRIIFTSDTSKFCVS